MKRYTPNKIITKIAVAAVSVQVALLANFSVADIIPDKVGTYKDESTGITIISGEAKLKGIYVIDSKSSSSIMNNLNFSLERNGVDEEEEQTGGYLSQNAEFVYSFRGILRDPTAKEAMITVKNYATNHEEIIRVDLVKAQKESVGREDFEGWAKSRAFIWGNEKSPRVHNIILENWIKRSEQIYGVKPYEPYRSRSMRDRFDNQHDLSNLSVFGGQVAINETLQTQLLDAGDADNSQKTIDVKTIKGVEVKSHPYTAMLAKLKANPSPLISELTRYVPEDRFMILLKDPRKIAHLFDEKNELYDGLAPFVGNGFVDHALFERYAARFGLELEQIKLWFSGKSVAELAFFTPDIFFLDNTDLTVIIRLKESAATPFKLASQLPSGKIMPMALPNAEPFYLASNGDLLFLSSNKDELQRSLDVYQNKQSLGHSDEFMVMNYQLPMMDDTKAYLYFSDPFIRNLTSPTMKIGQLRRAAARQTIETITAMQLLYRLDQGIDAKSINELVAKKYLLPNEVSQDEYQLSANGQVFSKTWGTLTNLKPLSANPVINISDAEAKAYNFYRDQYTSFWSEYFDPIAIRGDLTDRGAFSLETFILPLIDNSLYSALQGLIGYQLPDQSIVPTYQQNPVAMMAFRVPTDRKEIAREIERFMWGVLPAVSRVGEFLGDDVAIAIHDSAPIIQTQFPGIAQFDQFGRGFLGMGGSELLAAPIVGAYFTRPMSIAINLKDAAGMAQFLSNFNFPERMSEVAVDSFYNEDNQTLYASTILFGVVRMEFSFKVENGWLYISNSPWLNQSIVGTETMIKNHLALMVNGDAAKAIVPQLSSLARESYRQSALVSAGELLPWMRAYGVDALAASKIQKAALGVATVLPNDVVLSPELYGKNKIALKGWEQKSMALPNFKVWLRFEIGGLRTRIEFPEVKAQ